ncbi:MAG TPA: histidinol-phosphate transaminase [Chiayiivirga sp.]|nr:histidinol-phosphate transaminase [Chiayiivirga sp.]
MSNPILDLVRPDLRGFAGYGSARRSGASGSIWLNANENPCTNLGDLQGTSQRYPAPQPESLRQALAALYGVEVEQLLIGRGSDEAIDLLVRAVCRPECDAVVISNPVFGMYAVSARLQAAPLIDVPLRDNEEGFAADLDAMAEAALHHGAHLVFVCSPGNPTGHAASLAEIEHLAVRLAGRAIVVVDEAYVEFSDLSSAVKLLHAHRNVAVLRTLSKAHALAGARIGCLIADPELIAVLRNCQAPYPLPAPSVELALAALKPSALARTAATVREIVAERARLARVLANTSCVKRVYPSQGNFLLLRFADADAAFRALLGAGVVVRDQRGAKGLGDALRISIGTVDENDAVIAALEALT